MVSLRINSSTTPAPIFVGMGGFTELGEKFVLIQTTRGIICVAQIQNWASELEEIQESIDDQFSRSEPRANAMGSLYGL